MNQSELVTYRRSLAVPPLLVGLILVVLTAFLNKYVHAELGGYISLCLAFIGCAANKEAGGSKKEWQNNAILYLGFFAIGLGMTAFTAFIPFALGILLGIMLFIRGIWFFVVNALSCFPVPYTTERTAYISMIGFLVIAFSGIFRELL